MPKSLPDQPAAAPPDWEHFAGVYPPNYTQIPDDFLDFIAPFLSPAELRVALYIMRRTFGFKKDADAISVGQICHGIVTQDGRRQDCGTQLSRTSVMDALRGLLAKHLICKAPQQDERGSLPTVYVVNVRGTAERTPGYEKAAQGSTPGRTPGVQPRAPTRDRKSINRSTRDSTPQPPRGRHRQRCAQCGEYEHRAMCPANPARAGV